MEKRKPNRLIKEKSPYLLQHAYNPVDWYPWGEEAFEKAKREDKPVFLSIGYSTCHWCHVMEKESFEDDEVAKILNENFVPIKVDREERPDIDSVYMTVCQMLTGSGGWPLTVILTPDKKPFFAGTYFPKESYYGRPGLKELLLRIAQLWKEDRQKVLNSADKVISVLKEGAVSSEKSEIKEKVIEDAFGDFFFSFDKEFGGFGQAPKFPVPHNLMFLLRYYYRTQNENALKMVLFTLEKMRLGGIWDFVGHGFHRYSTDNMWLLPHFEKMLYDNALLMLTYAEAFQITKGDFFRETAEDIADYLLRDMHSQEGAFYSAEDADSEGEEGKFYIWDTKELKEILSEEEFNITLRVFNLKEDGNFLEEATRRKTGKNILFMAFPLEKHAERLGMEVQELKSRLEEIRNKLFKARQNRVRPLRDEKILTDWNALAVVAFAVTGRAFGRDDFTEVAKETASFILNNLYVEDGRLYHRYKDGEAKVDAFLEDYAYLIWAFTELYESTLEPAYLKWAVELTEHTLKHFWDKEGYGFFQTPDYGEELIVRKKETYDGALPSGNSVMAYNLIRLSRLTNKREYEDKGVKTLESYFQVLENYPSSHSFSLLALDLVLNGTSELVVVPSEGEKHEEALKEIRENFLPDLLVVHKDETTESINSFLKNLKPLDGKTTYYLCRNFSCQTPTTELGEVFNTLKG